MKGRLCPLRLIAMAVDTTDRLENDAVGIDCPESSDCAWWDWQTGLCVVVRLSQLANAFDPESSCVDVRILRR